MRSNTVLARPGAGAAQRVAEMLRRVLEADRLPVRLRCWDGSTAGPDDAPCIIVNARRALRRILWSPDEIGLGRAYVAGELDLDGDIFDTLQLLRQARAAAPGTSRAARKPRRRAEMLRLAAGLGAIGPNPAPPPEEAPRFTGASHTPDRDRRAIHHHYDVGNEFYRLVLGPTMTYSCAVWETPGVGLDAAETAKHDLVCRKLGLRSGLAGPGVRLLDVGCGWGSMVLHAARHYGVRAVGITLSREQALFAQHRVDQAGLADRVEIRVQDYREISDGPYDAISSIGMAEHVGESRMVQYAACLYRLLKPRGRLLNHAISLGKRQTGPPRDTFISRYVFPDGELLTIGQMVSALAEGGFEVRDAESLREHYAMTLRAWVANLEANWDRAVRLTSRGRARVWQLYMAGSALAFEAGSIGVNQVLCIKPDGEGASGLPLRRSW